MPLLKSKKILLSRTYTDASGKEFSEGGAAGGLVILKGLPTGKWTMKITVRQGWWLSHRESKLAQTVRSNSQRRTGMNVS